MTDTFNLRKAQPNDVPVVVGLVKEAYDKYLARMDVPPGPLRDDYAQLIADDVVWLADDGTRTIGLIVLIPQPDHLLLDNVAVRPGLQNRGLGRRMFDFAYAEARRLGFDELRLYTAEAMTENLRIYPHWGWVEYDRTVQKGYPRVFFRKKLAEAA
jgi:GNAT superfamily N-acetyltransferase